MTLSKRSKLALIFCSVSRTLLDYWRRHRPTQKQHDSPGDLVVSRRGLSNLDPVPRTETSRATMRGNIMKRNASIILFSVLSLLLAGCSLKPGTEMMLDQNGANAVLYQNEFMLEQNSGIHDCNVSKGTKVRVIEDHRDNIVNSTGTTEIYVLEGNARNHTFTVNRNYLLPMTATH